MKKSELKEKIKDSTISEEEIEALTETEIQLADSIAYQSSTSEGAFAPKAKPKSKPKTMGSTCQNGCKKNVKDVVMYGEDLFKLLSKASSENEGWMKSTKAFDTGKGVLVQVTTQQRNPDGSYAVAEALSFVPGVKVVEQIADSDGTIIRRLKSSN